MNVRMDDPLISGRLKKFTEEWQKTFEHVEDSVFVMDRAAHVVWGNRRFLQKAKLEPQACVGKKCYELLCHESCLFQESVWKDFFKSGVPHTMEVSGDQGEPILVMILPVFDAADQSVVGAVHLSKDITKYKDLEEFVGMIQLAGDTAHGINNGLTVINSNLDAFSEYIEVFLCREKLVEKMQEAIWCKAWEDVQMLARQLDRFERKVDYAGVLSDLVPLLDQMKEGSKRVRRATRGLRFFMPRASDKALTP